MILEPNENLPLMYNSGGTDQTRRWIHISPADSLLQLVTCLEGRVANDTAQPLGRADALCQDF